MAELSEEKHVGLNIKLLKMSKELHGLRKDKFAADQTIEILKRKRSEAVEVLENLRHKNLEAARTIGILKCQKSKAENEAECYRRRFISLIPRIEKLEVEFASIMNREMGAGKSVKVRSASGEEVVENDIVQISGPESTRQAIDYIVENDTDFADGGNKNMHSLCSMKEKDENDMKVETSSQTGKRSGYTPQADI